jgi:hypothetical protein
MQQTKNQAPYGNHLMHKTRMVLRQPMRIESHEGDITTESRKGDSTIESHEGDITTFSREGNITIELREGDIAT